MPFREFTGELDNQPQIREFTGELDSIKPPRQTVRGPRAQTPYLDRVAAAAGVKSLQMPDWSASERMDMGLSDTFEEKRAKFLAKNPAGSYDMVKVPYSNRTEIVYRRNPVEPKRIADEPGVAPGDFLDRPQEFVTLPAQAAIAMTGPAGWLAQAGLQAAVPGLAHLGKEAIETWRGYQQQPTGEVFGTAAMESGADAIAGGLFGGATALARGPVRNTARQLVDDYRDISNLLRLDPNIESPMPTQLRPDKKIVGRLAAQAGSTSEAMQGKLALQEETISDFLRKEQTVRLGKSGVELTRQARKGIDKERLRLRRQFNLDPAEAGKAIQGIFTDQFNQRSRRAINEAYAKAGALAEDVAFDLSGAQATAKRVTAPTMATATEMVDGEVVDLAGQPLTQEAVQTFVNVAASPGEKVGRVSRLLSVIDPEQQNWEVVKELRTQVGEAIKDIPQQDAVSGQAKAIYRELTAAMDNPIGGGQEFRAAWREANDLARYRFHVYENGKVLELMANASPATVARQLALEPGSLNPMIMDVIDSYVPEKKAIVKKAMVNRILGDPNRSQLIQQWDLDNPTAMRWMLGDKASSQEVRRVARNLDDLEKLPIAQFMASKEPMIRRGAELLNNTGPAELEKTIAMLGGRKSDAFQAMRMFAYDDILTRGSTVAKEGLPIPDGKKMATVIREYQERGIWDKVLTKEDKMKIKGLGAYSRRLMRSMSDTGTSLEQAQAIAALKHPSTMLQGVHALAVNNRILAPLLMSDKWGSVLAPKPKAGQMGRKRRGMVPSMTFLGNLTGSLIGLLKEEL